jgi:hypothetical protein
MRTLLVALLAALTGCGHNGLVTLTGQLEENGQAVRLEAGETVQLDFVTADGAYPPLNLGVYARPDGSFAVDMNDGTGNGLPPGKYKVKLNGEGTSIKKKVNPRLFKEAHLVHVSAEFQTYLTVDLANGTYTP